MKAYHKAPDQHALYCNLIRTFDVKALFVSNIFWNSFFSYDVPVLHLNIIKHKVLDKLNIPFNMND